jgi:hypothetical protein
MWPTLTISVSVGRHMRIALTQLCFGAWGVDLELRQATQVILVERFSFERCLRHPVQLPLAI